MSTVLMTADTVGGVFTYALELSAALAERGVTVHLATMGAAPTPAQRRAIAQVPRLVLHDSAYRLEWMDDPWDDVERAGEWLLDLERRIAPDVVHLNGYAHGALPWRAPTLMVAHSCVLSWWQAVLGEDAPPRYGRYRAEVQRGLAAADVVVAPTAAMLAAIEAHYGSPARGEVIPNGTDPSRFSAGSKEEIVFAAGRLWDQAKNVLALADVAPRLPWPVIAAGNSRRPGDPEPANGNAVNDKSMAMANAPTGFSPIHLAGELRPDEVASWLSRASIYALPARYEPFGLSILEAALSGCALVLGDIPSLREVWGDAALYVPPADRDALACAIRSLAAERPLRAAFAARARARALGYSPGRMARGYLTLYRSLARSSRAFWLDDACAS